MIIYNSDAANHKSGLVFRAWRAWNAASGPQGKRHVYNTFPEQQGTGERLLMYCPGQTVEFRLLTGGRSLLSARITGVYVLPLRRYICQNVKSPVVLGGVRAPHLSNWGHLGVLWAQRFDIMSYEALYRMCAFREDNGRFYINEPNIIRRVLTKSREPSAYNVFALAFQAV